MTDTISERLRLLGKRTRITPDNELDLSALSDAEVQTRKICLCELAETHLLKDSDAGRISTLSAFLDAVATLAPVAANDEAVQAWEDGLEFYRTHEYIWEWQPILKLAHPQWDSATLEETGRYAPIERVVELALNDTRSLYTCDVVWLGACGVYDRWNEAYPQPVIRARQTTLTAAAEWFSQDRERLKLSTRQALSELKSADIKISLGSVQTAKAMCQATPAKDRSALPVARRLTDCSYERCVKLGLLNIKREASTIPSMSHAEWLKADSEWLKLHRLDFKFIKINGCWERSCEPPPLKPVSAPVFLICWQVQIVPHVEQAMDEREAAVRAIRSEYLDALHNCENRPRERLAA